MICEYLKDWTAQQVFDKVAKHLLTQDARSQEGTACLYRGPNGLMCAAGCLIPDADYYGSLEGANWNSLVDRAEVPVEHHALIQTLQQVHDIRLPCVWLESLSNIAGEFGLNTEVLQ